MRTRQSEETDFYFKDGEISLDPTQAEERIRHHAEKLGVGLSIGEPPNDGFDDEEAEHWDIGFCYSEPEKEDEPSDKTGKGNEPSIGLHVNPSQGTYRAVIDSGVGEELDDLAFYAQALEWYIEELEGSEETWEEIYRGN